MGKIRHLDHDNLDAMCPIFSKLSDLLEMAVIVFTPDLALSRSFNTQDLPIPYSAVFSKVLLSHLEEPAKVEFQDDFGLCVSVIPIIYEDNLLAYFVYGVYLDRPLDTSVIPELARTYFLPTDQIDRCIASFKIRDARLSNIFEYVHNCIELQCKLIESHYETKQLNESLENSLQAKSNFLANMSHEIRTPMNAIIGLAEMTLKESLPEGARSYISQIKTSGRLLLTIINDILDFSKIESGKVEIVNVEYEFLSVLYDVIGTVSTRIAERDIFLLVDVDPNIPSRLYGDDIRIKQILVNISNNAVKFTNKGFIRIKVSYERKGTGVVLTFAIKDTGIGIKPEDMSKLFNSFEQVDSKRNRGTEGTGLGLKISKELAKLMGGDISVTSTYGEGSEFIVSIPQTIVREEPCSSITKKPNQVAGVFNNTRAEKSFIKLLHRFDIDYDSASSDYSKLLSPDFTPDFLFVDYQLYLEVKPYIPEKAPYDIVIVNNPDNPTRIEGTKHIHYPLYCLNVCNLLNNIKMNLETVSELDTVYFEAPTANILVVDDNAVNLTVAVGLLQSFKCNIETALSGDIAIDMIRKHKEPYDIILMDHMMPVKDGVETTHEIRELELDYVKSVPIIALTANAMRGARELFIDEGLNDFIAKPIEVKELINKMRTWLPPEKIKRTIKTEEQELNDEAISLGKIVGIDSDYGLSMTGSIENYLKVLTEYYKGIDKTADKIQLYWEQQLYKDYTILVHSLKSTSKMIGAVELGNMAEALEEAGKAQNTELIDEQTGALLQVYRGYKSLLQPHVLLEDEKLNQPTVVTTKELIEILGDLKLELIDFNIDGADILASKLSKSKFPKVVKPEDISTILELVENVDYDEAVNHIDTLLETLTK